MLLQSLTIELAGLCATVDTDNRTIRRYLTKQFGGFFSTNKPTFKISVVPPPPETESSRKQFPSRKGNLDFSSMRITRHKNRFLVSSGQSSRRPPVSLGMIDAGKGVCRLYNRPELMSQAFMDTFILSCFQFFLMRAGGFILHASAVARNGRALVFTGPSGSGKTTVAALSRCSTVLSDDLVCVRRHGASFYAHGTPWHAGKREPSAGIDAILMLRHGKATSFERLTPGIASRELMINISMNLFDRRMQATLLKTISDLTMATPCYSMRFSLKDPFWDMLNKSLSENQFEP